MFNSKNQKLIINLLLMFCVYIIPKVFSFFLIPIYTACLTANEYGVSDLIASTASLIIPFVSLATPNAVMRYTIEDNSDKRPFQISLKISMIGFSILAIVLVGVYFVFSIDRLYLVFLLLTCIFSIITDINLSYSRGVEKMSAVTICGVGGSLTMLVCNIIFIVYFKWGLFGFLLASISGYIFQIVSLTIMNYSNHLYKNFFDFDIPFTKEMLGFSIPLIFSGLSWWALSSSDRYFVTIMCGTAANGIYSVAYKIPTILQSVDNVFGQAWIFTVYDSYKDEDGKKYIRTINEFYIFIICLVGSLLISLDITISKFLYAKEFFLAWKYVPLLVIAVVFSACGGLMAIYISIYKKTKAAMLINTMAALLNILLNFILIYFFKDAIGAAIATVITFFCTWLANTLVGKKISGIDANLPKCIFMYSILFLQVLILLYTESEILTFIGVLFLLAININNLKILYRKIYAKISSIRSKIRQ